MYSTSLNDGVRGQIASAFRESDAVSAGVISTNIGLHEERMKRLATIGDHLEKVGAAVVAQLHPEVTKRELLLRYEIVTIGDVMAITFCAVIDNSVEPIVTAHTLWFELMPDITGWSVQLRKTVRIGYGWHVEEGRPQVILPHMPLPSAQEVAEQVKGNILRALPLFEPR